MIFKFAKTKDNSFFLNAFPRPNVLNMGKAGLDISDFSIKYVELTGANHKRRAKLFLEKKNKMGVLEEGVVKKRDEFLRNLKELRLKVKNNFVQLSFPDERTHFFQLSVPRDASFNEIKDIVLFHLEENVPIDPQDTIFDFVVKERDDSEHSVAFVSAISEKEANNYCEMVKEAGFIPISIQARSSGAGLAVSEDEREVFILLSFEEKKTSISIVEGGVVSFNSVIGIGVFDIIQTLSSFDGTYEKKDEDEGFVKRKDFTGNFFEVSEALMTFREEINKIFSYWASKGKKEEEIKKIVLLGGGVSQPGFADYISHITERPVKIGNVWHRVFDLEERLPEIDLEDSLIFGTAIGLAI